MNSARGGTPHTGQTALNSSTATVLAAAPTGAAQGSGRVSRKLVITNLSATIVVYIGGDSTVTSSTGFPLTVSTGTGATITLEVDDPSRVYAIAASATPSVAWVYI